MHSSPRAMIERVDASLFEVESMPVGAVTRRWLRLFELPGFGPVEVPLCVVRGKDPGPLLFVVAGVHGNEYEGMEAIRQLIPMLEPASMAGDFAAVIVANPFAYASRTRESPAELDGLNLARVFPGDATGDPTRKLAAALFDLVVRTVGVDDLLLDLHSGTAETAFATMVGFRQGTGPARVASEEAARHMGLPLLWEIPDSPGPLNAETARRGIPTIGTETTGRAGCRAEDVAAYVQGLRNMLAYLGICPDWERPPRDNQRARTTVDLLAPATGFLRVETGLLAEVESGQRLGLVIDPFGTVLDEVVSPVAGTVWAAREVPQVNVGDLIFMIAER